MVVEIRHQEKGDRTKEVYVCTNMMMQDCSATGEEILEADEVFDIGDGRFLIVEG